MAQTSELTLTTRLFLKAYRWRQIDPVPFAPLSKPLAECRVGLVSSAGFVAPGVEPFDEELRGGDSSWRSVPSDADTSSFSDSHRSESFDHTGMERDPELVFPLTRLHELAAEGWIGEVAPRHASCMGSITATGRLVNESAPDMAAQFVEDQVDLVLLVPV
ncbi:MAG: glycine/sarcosine/betaine reductase selenoprotein B family protein [Planctomycetota bacterium]|nr:glycine/sarcosine/betaine reductase selenoprotein B family protein [Planctomycetota bacterium]